MRLAFFDGYVMRLARPNKSSTSCMTDFTDDVDVFFFMMNVFLNI